MTCMQFLGQQNELKNALFLKYFHYNGSIETIDCAMNQDIVAKRLSELGHSTRLSVFRLAVKAGDSGLPVGEIQTTLDISASTLSHHIHRLVGVGLMSQQREGRVLNCIANLDALREVMAFLDAECCTL